MYRIYDTSAAIREVQKYLSLVGDPAIFVAPSGAYDQNTRESVRELQRREGLAVTGEVDRETFELLYHRYALIKQKNLIRESLHSSVDLPIRPGASSAEMLQMNNMLARLLNYYNIPHNLRRSGYYSSETSKAVRELKKIYKLDIIDEIDAIFYGRMSNDVSSIDMLDYNFG